LIVVDACGSSRAAEPCPDKLIVGMCSIEFQYRRETTDDGCE